MLLNSFWVILGGVVVVFLFIALGSGDPGQVMTEVAILLAEIYLIFVLAAFYLRIRRRREAARMEGFLKQEFAQNATRLFHIIRVDPANRDQAVESGRLVVFAHLMQSDLQVLIDALMRTSDDVRRESPILDVSSSGDTPVTLVRKLEETKQDAALLGIKVQETQRIMASFKKSAESDFRTRFNDRYILGAYDDCVRGMADVARLLGETALADYFDGLGDRPIEYDDYELFAATDTFG